MIIETFHASFKREFSNLRRWDFPIEVSSKHIHVVIQKKLSSDFVIHANSSVRKVSVSINKYSMFVSKNNSIALDSARAL